MIDVHIWFSKSTIWVKHAFLLSRRTTGTFLLWPENLEPLPGQHMNPSLPPPPQNIVRTTCSWASGLKPPPRGLKDAGINVFNGDEEIRRGQNVTAVLAQAIQGSRISVIVFSRSYAASTWCLEELVKIMECRRTLRQMGLPKFYDVRWISRL